MWLAVNYRCQNVKGKWGDVVKQEPSRWQAQFDELTALIRALEAMEPKPAKEIVAAYAQRARAIEELEKSPFGRR